MGWENPLEKGMATHSSILAGRIPMDRGAWRATVHGVAKSQTRMKQPSRHTHLQVAYIISTQFQAHSFTLTTRGLKKWDIPMSPERRNGSAEDTSGLHCRTFLI